MSLNLFMILFLSLATLLSISEALHSNGARTFVFGIPRNLEAKENEAKIIITTVSEESLEVNITVNETVYSGTVNATHGYSLDIPDSLIVKDSYAEDRDKGIIVEASGEVEVTAYNRYTGNAASIGAFRVLPYTSLPELYQYRYYGISTGNKYEYHGLILLVGCEEDTIVNIKPSVNIQIPQDPQLLDSNIADVLEGQTHQVVLHRGQTLLLKVAYGDLTGTEIISNKPLTVISGHECARMPVEIGGCDQITAQIPPTVTWGKEFILLPLSGRTSGHIYKVLASQNDTIIKHNCNNNVPSDSVLSEGEVMQFWSGSYRSCHVRADRPIIIAQFSLGQNTDGVGDPTLTIVPPMEQYVHEISFQSFSGESTINDQYMNIIVPSDCFHRNQIILDGKIIMCEWSLVYSDSESVIGYSCKMSLEPNTAHTLTHSKPGGHMALSVYGFTGRKGYSYNAGFAMKPLNAIVKVQFSMSSYQVRESDEYLLVQVTRMDDVVSPAGVTVTALSGTAYSSKDYVQLKQDLIFEIGEKHKTVKVYMINDGCVEETETFKLVIDTHNMFSPSSEATVDIIDDDSIQIGFYSPQDGGQALYEDEEKTFIVEILNGSLPLDDQTANITLSLEIVESTDTTSPPHVEMVTFSSGKNRSVVSYKQRNHDNDVSSLVGFLKVDKTDKVNKDQINLKPSVNVLHIHPVMSSSIVSVLATVTPTRGPTSPPFIEHHSSSKPTASIGTIILIASISCFCTALVVVAFALFGCFLSYKYGQNNDFRYQYFRRKTPPRETYIVNEVVNPV